MGEGVSTGAVVAIDPGCTHTGMVHMDAHRVIACSTARFKERVGSDNDALARRCEEVWQAVREFLDTHPHDVVVVEGYRRYNGRGGMTMTHQTPWLVGALLAHLADAGEDYAIQLSAQVLNPTAHGNAAWCMQKVERGCAGMFRGQSALTNEHMRSAFAHGWYYLHTGEGAPNEEG